MRSGILGPMKILVPPGAPRRRRSLRLLVPLIAAVIACSAFAWVNSPIARQAEPAVASAPDVQVVAGPRRLVIQVPTAMRDEPVPATLLLPSAYASQPERAFPVLYMLHGAGGNHEAWADATGILALAEAHEIVVVCPDAGKTSWYFDSPLGAMFLAIRHPDTFGAAVAMSGGVDIRPFPDDWDIAKRIGTYADAPERWEELTVINQARRLKPGQVAISIDCGVDDFFLDVNRALHAQLLAAGIPHDYTERPGAHTWSYWDRSIRYQMLFISEHFHR